MNAIVGFSNLMNTDIELSKAERENFTELINTNSDLLLNLINDILDLSRIESGRMSFSFQQYSLNEFPSFNAGERRTSYANTGKKHIHSHG